MQFDMWYNMRFNMRFNKLFNMQLNMRFIMRLNMQCDHQGKMEYPPNLDFEKIPPNTDILEQISP